MQAPALGDTGTMRAPMPNTVKLGELVDLMLEKTAIGPDSLASVPRMARTVRSAANWVGKVPAMVKSWGPAAKSWTASKMPASVRSAWQSKPVQGTLTGAKAIGGAAVGYGGGEFVGRGIDSAAMSAGAGDPHTRDYLPLAGAVYGGGRAIPAVAKQMARAPGWARTAGGAASRTATGPAAWVTGMYGAGAYDPPSAGEDWQRRLVREIQEGTDRTTGTEMGKVAPERYKELQQHINQGNIGAAQDTVRKYLQSKELAEAAGQPARQQAAEGVIDTTVTGVERMLGVNLEEQEPELIAKVRELTQAGQEEEAQALFGQYIDSDQFKSQVIQAKLGVSGEFAETMVNMMDLFKRGDYIGLISAGWKALPQPAKLAIYAGATLGGLGLVQAMSGGRGGGALMGAGAGVAGLGALGGAAYMAKPEMFNNLFNAEGDIVSPGMSGMPGTGSRLFAEQPTEPLAYRPAVNPAQQVADRGPSNLEVAVG